MSKPNRWKRRLIWLAALPIAGYLALCAFVFAVQDQLLFHPTAIPDQQARELAALPDVEPLHIDVEGATLQGFFVAGRGRGPRPTVLYFGGNAEPVWQRVAKVPSPTQAAFNRVYVSYRGYDRSSGTPSADAMLTDAVAIYDAVAAREDVRNDAIVPWGLSLGTGLATYVAHERPAAGVILLAPYDRLASVAGEHYPYLPVSALMTNDIDSGSRAPTIDAPALIVHGDADRIIGSSHGEALAKAWRGAADFVLLPGVGHNDLSARVETKQRIDAFLTSLGRG